MSLDPEAILDALPAHVAVLDPRGKIVRVNKAWRAFAALDGIEPIKVGRGVDYLAVCDNAKGDDEADAVHAALGIRSVLGAKTGSFSCEYACHSRRERRWFRVEVVPVMADGCLHAIVMHHDITQLRELDAGLMSAVAGIDTRSGEPAHGALARQMAGALGTKYAFVGCLKEPGGTTVQLLGAWAGDGAGRLFEYDAKGTPCEVPVRGGTCQVSSRVQQQYPTDEMLIEIGAESYLGVPVFGAAGTPLGLVSVVDVKPFQRMKRATELLSIFAARAGMEMERSSMAQNLNASEGKWRALVENAPAYVVILDRAGVIRFINRSESPTLTREQFVHRSVYELLPPEHEQAVRNALASVFERGEIANLKISSAAADKPRRWYAVRVGPIRSNGVVESAIWIGTNITEQQALEEQLRVSQKMESIGRLAGGVAHDFNNLLTAIMGHAELIATRPRSANERDHARQILDASGRAADLTRQLLAFSRKQVLQPKNVNLNDIISESVRLLTRLIGEDVALKTVLAADLSSVLADPSQINQVIMNLAINARDAMPKGGSLTIETRNTELAPEFATRHDGLSAGQYVQLSVSDTGEGMGAETLARIFEPFFTTKPQGKGTGLGLATVHGIVKQSGGHISVYSEPGHGACFELYFPVRAGAPEPHWQPGIPVPESRGTERILLVEDDQSIRDLAYEALVERGYRVTPTGSPAEALDLRKNMRDSFDLLLTDVILPGMGGRALAETMGRTQPGLKVLYMSGYTDNAIVHHGMLDKGISFMQKPFSIAQIAAKVREVLDGNAS